MKKHKYKSESVKEQNEDAKRGDITVHDPLANKKIVPFSGGGDGDNDADDGVGGLQDPPTGGV
jgi:hypothetical protein